MEMLYGAEGGAFPGANSAVSFTDGQFLCMNRCNVITIFCMIECIVLKPWLAFNKIFEKLFQTELLTQSCIYNGIFRKLCFTAYEL